MINEIVAACHASIVVSTKWFILINKAETFGRVTAFHLPINKFAETLPQKHGLFLQNSFI